MNKEDYVTFMKLLSKLKYETVQDLGDYNISKSYKKELENRLNAINVLIKITPINVEVMPLLKPKGDSNE